jgi:hypothetical protein
MQVGFYRKRPHDFSIWRAANFKFQNLGHSSGAGCGANAISTLTGTDPYAIRPKNRKGHFSDKFMLTYLRNCKFVVTPVTMCDVSHSLGYFGLENTIKPDHVILLSALLHKNEASWLVMHKGNIVHNFGLKNVGPLDFINRPILSAYAVFHQKWT